MRTASTLTFKPRSPSRSWIRAYNPSSNVILRLREVERDKRSSMIVARFIAYDITTHNTLGIRFRKTSADGKMMLQLGPLGSAVAVTGVRNK